MTKSKSILICIVLICIFSTIIYLNYDNIQKYIDNKEWQMIDSIATITIDKYIDITATNSGLIIINSDGIKGYNNVGEERFNILTPISNVVKDHEKDFCIIGEKNGTKVYCINKDKKSWEITIAGNIQGVSINKNGYATIIYTQSGYKSLIKVIKPNGEEMFTNYLATTYAVDTTISNDNKLLAIAEVNTEGIKVESAIKIIRLDDLSDENVSSINLGSNTFIASIEFNDKNEILILENNKIQLIDSKNEIQEIVKYNYTNESFADISNKNMPVLISKTSTGIFDTEYKMKIYKNKDSFNEYIMNNVPKQIYCQNKIVATDMGNEVLFIGTNGRLIKRCTLQGQIKQIQLYSDGNMAGLVFRDKVEIIKL